MKRNARNRMYRSMAVLAALLVGVPAAVAQNNSLMGKRKAPTPSSQPAARATATAGDPAPGVAADTTAAAHAARANSGNVVLLRFSPFAVETPAPEKIKVNDQITIIVRESKTATSDSKMESKKDWTFDAALDKWIRLSDSHGIVPAKFEAGTPAGTFSMNNDYKGEGKNDRTDELTTRIQATVIDVKPNGTLVLEARKSIAMDEDGYTIRLTGDCRAKDITPQNTVLSTQVANLDVDVKHIGQVRDATRRGWLMRAFDFMRPF